MKMKKIVFPLLLVVLFLATGAFFVSKEKTNNWKTYENLKYGFSFQYPAGFFENRENLNQEIKNTATSKLLFEISDKANFDQDQFAFLLDGNLSTKKPLTTAVANENLLTVLNLQALKTRLKVDVVADFFGNPPYAVYAVTLPLPHSQGLYLVLSAQTHNQNREQDLKVFNQILSSFKFI